MGTKNNPGKFDCYASAEPDEPLFTLLAHDPLAPSLVRIWAALRENNIEAAQQELSRAYLDHGRDCARNPAPEKVREAYACSNAMEIYKIGLRQAERAAVERLIGPGPGREHD